MKRYGKVFIMSLISILALTVPVFAREMTSQKLGTEAAKRKPKASYIYVIGEYAFTSEHQLTTQDVMLAARSIDPENEDGKTNEDDIYDEMTIFTVEGEYDAQATLTGWELGDNVIGTSKLKDGKFNIRYIDYDYVKDLYTVTLNTDEGNEYKESITVEEGEKINEADITGENRPTKDNYQFKEWIKVKDDEDGEPWNFEEDTVDGNITLKATWYDEVNTDKLLENAKKTINEGTKKNGYYYDVDFEKGILTFNVYDLNKKNSEIQGTGLIGDIVNIVNTDNVQSITISTLAGDVSVIFDEDDANNGAGPESAAWKQFAYLLCKLTGTECSGPEESLQKFVNIKLGDLIEKDLKLTITLDENNARSQNNKVTEDYEIKFSFNPQAEIKVASKDLHDYNYKFQDTYTITGEKGIYNVGGYVTEQEGITGFGDDTSGFYFAYIIELDEGIDVSKAKVKIPTDENGTTYNEDTFDARTRTVTVLMEVEEDEATKYRDIIVEVDEVPTKIRIDFTELKLRKNSKFTVEGAESESKLNTNYGWTKPNDYKVDYKTEGETVNVTGLLTIHDNNFTGSKNPFGDAHETGYYIAFAIKTNNDKTDNKTTVKITDGDETINVTSENFDDSKTLYVLKHLHPEKEARKFTIEVDMDGGEEKYNPYTITVDWSELKLQVDSVATIELNQAAEKDKKAMSELGYTIPERQNVTLENGMLTGTLVEQSLTSDAAFGADNKDGFYFDFTIKHPEGVTLVKDNIEIMQVKDATAIGEDISDGDIIKKFSTDELDERLNLTILKRFPKETTSCTECAEKEACDSSCCGDSGVCDKVLYFVVDWDGKEGKEYLPVLYTIDYCKVTFEKSSIFTVSNLLEDDKNEFGSQTGDNDGSWYDIEKGYSVQVAQDEHDATKYKVTGVLPIFDDDQDSYDTEFTTNEGLYYLGLVLKLDNKVSTSAKDKITVKFLHNDGQNDNQEIHITPGDFEQSNELHVLKALAVSETKKEFTITVDIDGEGSEYLPYTVTIDWSGLKLQNESLDDVDYDVADEAEIANDTDLSNWGFNADTVEGVYVKTDDVSQPDREPSKVGLEGIIKEQTIEDGAGFKENEGYFVPIKISFPKENYLQEYSSKWTITLYDEDGQKMKPYKPTEEEYSQGWVMVLFKLKDEGGILKYVIDFDGDEMAYLPTEYTIEYSSLTFKEAHQVSFNGEGVTEQPITVYTGDTLTEDMLPDPVESDDPYHEFVYWNKKDGTKFDEIKFANEKDADVEGKETGNIELVPHWNLYSDKFVSDVLNDLNKTTDSQSLDFSNEFVIEEYEANSGEVTITVKDPEITLSRMNDTSIPGMIAYILLKDEIQSVTLEVKGQTKEFTKVLGTEQGTLKQAIKNEAQELYNGILSSDFEGKNDTEVTLSDLAHKEGLESFKLKFDESKIAKTVTLVQEPVRTYRSTRSVIEVPTEYNFTFKSDAVVVKSEDDLNRALQGEASYIFIGDSFNVKSTIEVNREVVIGSNDKYTITAENENEAIFDVKSNPVTIDSIKLSGAKTPIVVSSGELITTGLHFEGDKTEAAIEVKNGATLTASELTYDGETYEKPAVKAEKDNATVNLTDSTSNTATKVEKEKITTYENGKDTDQTEKFKFGDYKEKDSAYEYYNYYNKKENSKIYTTTFHSHEGSTKASFVRYNYYNEQVTKPYDESPFSVFKSYNYDGHIYSLIGFAESRDSTVYFGEWTTENVPSGVIKATDIIAKSDMIYYAAYNGTLKEGVEKVTNKATFKAALKKQEVSEIYIDTTELIDLSDEALIINRNLSIIGEPKMSNIKVKNITIENNAKDVFIQWVNITAVPDSGTTNLIEVKGKKFTMWQSSLKNEGTQVDSAIKYSGETSIVDVRWSSFYAKNIKNTYIDITTPIAAVSDIYNNTFEKLTLDNNKKSAITIKKFDSTAKLSDDGDETISIDINRFNDTDYAIKILKEASSDEADIAIESPSTNVTIAVQYDEGNNKFDKIKIHLKGRTDIHKIQLKYIDDEGSEHDRLDNGTQVQVQVPMEM